MFMLLIGRAATLCHLSDGLQSQVDLLGGWDSGRVKAWSGSFLSVVASCHLEVDDIDLPTST